MRQQRGRRTDGVFRVHHDDAALAHLGVVLDQLGHVDLFRKELVGQLQIRLEIVRAFEQVLGRPDRIHLGIAACGRGQRPPADPDCHARAVPLALHVSVYPHQIGPILSSVLCLLSSGTCRLRVPGAGADRAAHPDQVGPLLGQLQQRPPRWVVVDVELVRVGGVHFEAADLVEVDRGAIHRLAAQRGHQPLTSGFHAGRRCKAGDTCSVLRDRPEPAAPSFQAARASSSRPRASRVLPFQYWAAASCGRFERPTPMLSG